MTSDIAAFHELITSSAEKPPDRIYMSAARMTSSCLLAANFAASTRVSRAATTSFGSVPSTTQMHLSPAARPASREGEQDLVALELVGVEAADVIAQRCFDAGDAQIEGIRYGTNPDRQKLLEEASLVASGGTRPVTA
jgi:hypothetical protein